MTVGVVAMAYGTPTSVDDVERYYTHIRRGQPPSAEQLAELKSRYESIGGASPLRVITEAQADELGRALGEGYSVAVGQKHAEPFIEGAVGALERQGCERLVGLVLAPHHAASSTADYFDRLAAAASDRGIPCIEIERWHDLREWRTFQAGAVGSALASLPERTKVLFTAHSLPERALVGSGYEDELRDSATAIAREAGLDLWTGWTLAWQSAGRTDDAWRGPDISDVLRDLAETGRADGALVCPQGFTGDHLEVLYDLDVVAAGVAREVGLAFGRTASVNSDPAVMAALAERVRAA